MSQGRPRLKRPPANCHPEKDAYKSSGGLCLTCYKREWAREKRKRNPPQPKPIIVRMATCHPHKRHWGRGLCVSCFMREYRHNKPEVNKKATAKWRLNNKDKIYAKHLRYSYGLSMTDYKNMFMAQQESCALCGLRPPKNPVVDHCHTTDKVRGIVCQRCNIAIGLFETYKDIVALIPDYLEFYGRKEN